MGNANPLPRRETPTPVQKTPPPHRHLVHYQQQPILFPTIPNHFGKRLAPWIYHVHSTLLPLQSPSTVSYEDALSSGLCFVGTNNISFLDESRSVNDDPGAASSVARSDNHVGLLNKAGVGLLH